MIGPRAPRILASAALSALLVGLAAARPASGQVRIAPRIGAQLQLAPRWSLRAYERFVHGARIAATGRAQSFLGGGFEPLPWLDLGAGYRVSGEMYRGSYASSHRLQAEANAGHTWRGLRLSWRGRWQGAWSPSRAGYAFETVLRNRAQLRWRAHKTVDLAASAELFSQLDPARIAADALRIEASLTGRLRGADLSLGYRFHGPLEGGANRYHMIQASVLVRWEAPAPARSRPRDRDGTGARGRRRDRPGSPRPR
jgi:hypothetical protein